MRPHHYILATAAGTILGASAAYYLDAPPPSATSTICRAVHRDDLDSATLGRVESIRWHYPAQRIIVDRLDGSVRALPVYMVPSPCNPGIQEDEILEIR